MTSQDLSPERFQFVPLQDFTRPWTDADLYAKYGLTDEGIQFIESMIKPMKLKRLHPYQEQTVRVESRYKRGV